MSTTAWDLAQDRRVSWLWPAALLVVGPAGFWSPSRGARCCAVRLASKDYRFCET